MNRYTTHSKKVCTTHIKHTHGGGGRHGDGVRRPKTGTTGRGWPGRALDEDEEDGSEDGHRAGVHAGAAGYGDSASAWTVDEGWATQGATCGWRSGRGGDDGDNSEEAQRRLWLGRTTY